MNTSIAIAMKEAKERAGLKIVGNSNDDISALLNFSVSTMTPKEIEEKKKEAEERKANAQTLADKIAAAEAEIAKITAIPDWEIHPELVSRHKELTMFLIKTEAAGDEAFRASLAVSNLINRIRIANPQSDAEVEVELRNVAKQSRGNLVLFNENLPEGAVRFKNLCLVHIKSKIYPNLIASPADQSIFRALKEMIGRYIKTAKKDKKEKIDTLKGRGNSNLADLKNKKQGIYGIHFSEKRFKGDDGKPVYWEEGVALVELKDISKNKQPFLVIMAVDALGSLRWMAEYKGQWVPWQTFITGRVVEEKTPPEKLEFAKRFAKAIHKALCEFER